MGETGPKTAKAGWMGRGKKCCRGGRVDSEDRGEQDGNDRGCGEG